MKRILVTGAAGFLGFHLVRRLSQSGNNQVTCVDNFIRGESDAHYQALKSRPNVQSYDIDLCDPRAVDGLPGNFDIIYHLAALNGTQNFYERPLDVVRCCVLPTLNLIERYARAVSPPTFIFAGTSESYASTVTCFNWPVPTAEDVPLSVEDTVNPRWSYGASKTVSEIAVTQAGRTFTMPYSIIRYHNAYGPRMGDKHVIPDFLQRAKSGELSLFGHEDTRSFMYVDDSINATIAVGESEICRGEIINIGSEQEISIHDLALTIMRVCELSGEINLHPSPKGSVKRRVPDTTKLRKLTGFTPTTSLDVGLKKTASFYLDGKWAD